MISSAVVIPEQEVEQASTTSSLKRRQSSISSDSSKRPRLDTQNGSRSHDGGPMSPPSRRRSALGSGAAEEKKRGQRLLGALLGTLSQTSSKPAHKRRDEIEQRQRERARKDTEEKREEERRKRDELNRSRHVEQEAWEKEGMRIRHRNMRAMAGFLQTKTEPRLYYKPWELREEDEQQIKRQIKEAEATIKHELGERAAEKTERKHADVEERKEPDKVHVDDHQMDSVKPDSKSSEEQVAADEQPGHDMNEADQMETDKTDERDVDATQQKPAEDDKSKDDDHAGEELVEGQEDDVIY